jgi:hypothetical protein
MFVRDALREVAATGLLRQERRLDPLQQGAVDPHG